MSESAWSFDAILEDVDDDTAKALRDSATLILSGLDQTREAIGYKMGDVRWKRMGELAQRLAVETVDWTAVEGFLIGSWMAASCRAQLQQRAAE